MNVLDLAVDYEIKLNAMKVLRQALESGLITQTQYNLKQEEFLDVVHFNTPSHDTSYKVAAILRQMEKDLESARTRGMQGVCVWMDSIPRVYL